MPDAALAALELPGVWWLAATLVAAGIVRGFSGFGSALIFVPVAGIFLPLGFFTGLFGMNVGGLPFTDTPWGFAIVCLGMAGSVVVVLAALRILRLI